MSYKVNIHEYNSVTSLEASDRYEYLLNRVTDWQSRGQYT